MANSSNPATDVETAQCVKCGSTQTSRWYHQNTVCASCNKKMWYLANKKRALHASQKWRSSNQDKVRTIKSQWFQANKRRVYAYRKNRTKNDIGFKLSCNIRSRLANAIKTGAKTGSAIQDLGCSVEELKRHIESLWQPGMSWDNYGKGDGKWNLDHIVPLCSFNLLVREECIKACHYTNLQPMWEIDNLRKAKHDKDKKQSNRNQ